MSQPIIIVHDNRRREGKQKISSSTSQFPEDLGVGLLEDVCTSVLWACEAVHNSVSHIDKSVALFIKIKILHSRTRLQYSRRNFTKFKHNFAFLGESS